MSSILKSESIEVGSTLLLASGALAILLAATLSGLEFGFWPVSGFYIGFISIFIALGNKNRLRLSRSSEVAGILSLLALIIGSWLVAPSYISLILIVVLMAEAPYILSKRQSWILLAVSNLAFFAVFMGVWQASNIVLDWISMFALQAFALTSSLARVQETQLKHTLADQNAELTAARSALAEKSQMEERLRIAGDLHDGIGHQITALRLQLEALFQLAPAQLKPRVANSQQLSGELLENIRSIVKRMSCVQIVELDTLIKQIDEDTPGVNIRLTGAIPKIDPMLQQQLASCIKEALSNAIRHGGASQVTLSFKNNLLIIDDNGSGIVNKVELGFGLSNLLKRLAPFGGKFKLGSREPTGCRLEISLESGIAL